MKKTDPPIIVQQRFQTSREDLWSAITDIKRMSEWYFEMIPDFRAEEGFTTEFVIRTPEREFVHKWRIEKVVPGEMISCHWSYSKYPGEGLVTMEIRRDKEEIIFTLTNEVLEDFDDSIPEFKRESCIGGWKWFINDRLANYISKNSTEN